MTNSFGIPSITILVIRPSTNPVVYKAIRTKGALTFLNNPQRQKIPNARWSPPYTARIELRALELSRVIPTLANTAWGVNKASRPTLQKASAIRARKS